MSDNRFLRFNILMGDSACQKLASAKVLVCGVGAVGGFAVEILARCGVGNFLIADCDKFELSNINRQICALESTLGMSKTQVQKNRILDINPAANVEIFDGFIDKNSIPKLLEYRPDVLTDAIDTISSKIELIKSAILSDIYVVSSMGAARRTDASFIKTASLSKSFGCPMAARVRKDLRAQNVDISKCECVFSDESAKPESHIQSGAGSAKKIMGSSPIVTSIFGIRLADLAISKILKDVVR